MNEFESFAKELAGDGTPAGHLSPTQLATYLRCPAQYHYRWVRGVKIPPSGSQVVGRSVHEAAAHNYRHKLETRSDLPEDEVVEKAVATFESEIESAQLEPDEKPPALKDQAAALARLYRAEVAPAVQPEMVEQRVVVPVANATVVGYVDVADEEAVIHDTKTFSPSRASGVAEKMHDDLQLNAYAAAYRHLKGHRERAVQLDVLVKAKEPKVVQHRVELTEYDVQRWARTAARVADAIKKGAFWPNHDWWGCSPKYCGYYAMCHKEW